MKFKSFSDYKAHGHYYYASNLEGITLTKPRPAAEIFKESPRIRAVKIEFDNAAFKKIDPTRFIIELIDHKQLEFLQIEHERSLSMLPHSMGSSNLKVLDASVPSVESFDNILPYMTPLEELKLTFRRASLGKLGKLVNLVMLEIHADEVIDLDSICDLPNLKYLSLHVKKLPALPKNLSKLTKLRHLSLCNTNLREFPDGLNLPSLQTLTISGAHDLDSIPPEMLSETLEQIHISDTGLNGLALPSPSHQLRYLREVYIANAGVNILPEWDVPELRTLKLVNIPVKQVCNRIKGATELSEIAFLKLNLEGDDITSLSGKKIKTFKGSVFSTGRQMDFGIWPDLEELFLDKSPNASFEIGENKALKKILIRGIAGLTTLPVLPEYIVELKVYNCNDLEYIDLSDKHYALFNFIHIADNEKLAILEINSEYLPQLRTLKLANCPNLSQLPADLLQLSEIENIGMSGLHPDTFDPSTGTAEHLLRALAKHNISPMERHAAGYWFFQKYLYKKPAHDILYMSQGLLRSGHDSLYKLVGKNLKYFNPGHKTIHAFTPAEIAGKKIAIMGDPFEALAYVKENIKELNAVYTPEIPDADFILIGKNFESEMPVGGNFIFITESDLNQYINTHTPRFLTQKDVTDEHINNLRQILWSTDPNTELMAYEMLQKGGMPNDVIGECIAIARTSKDSDIKNKFNNFLKVTVAPETLRLLLIPISFDKNDAFRKLRGKFPDELLGKLAMALYQRTQNNWGDVLDVHHADFDIRREIVRNHIIPKVLEHPNNVSLRHFLTHDELMDVLSLPQLRGELKKLTIHINHGALPDILGEHATLKALAIHGDLTTNTIPEVIFKLKNLTELKITSTTLAVLDEKIGQLQELNSLTIYNKMNIQIPASLRDLPKLSRIHFSNGAINAQLATTLSE